MKGRKRKPTAMKLLDGNPGKRAIPRNEPRPDIEIPDPPDHVKGEALHEWHRISVDLHDLGLLTAIDRSALAVYCMAYGRWVEAEDGIRKHGLLVKSPKGYPMQSPLLAIANRAMDQMKSILVEFGMTPSSRTRVAVANADGAKARNPFGNLATG